MANDLLNALNRKLDRYEKAGLPEQVELVKAKIASLTPPKKAAKAETKTEPKTEATTTKAKED